MPNPAYAKFKINGTDIPGEVVSADGSRDQSVEILEVHHEVILPTEVSGRGAGKRLHKPLRLIKKIDKTTPSLIQALSHNSDVEVELRWYKPGEDGTMQNFFTHTVKQARVVGVKTYLPYVGDPAKERFTEMEEVSFAYQEITWSHETTGGEYTDEGWDKY